MVTRTMLNILMTTFVPLKRVQIILDYQHFGVKHHASNKTVHSYSWVERDGICSNFWSDSDGVNNTTLSVKHNWCMKFTFCHNSTMPV